MDCSFGHDTVQMIEISRHDNTSELVIYYSCPTCGGENKYVLDKLFKSAKIIRTKKGIFEKKHEEENAKAEKERQRAQWREGAPKFRNKDKTLTCANNHPPLPMVLISSNFYDDMCTDEGHWFQCSQCYIKKFYSNEGIFDEQRGIEWERERHLEAEKIRNKKKAEQERRIREERIKLQKQEEERHVKQIEIDEENARVLKEKSRLSEIKINNEQIAYKKYIPLGLIVFCGFSIFFRKILILFIPGEGDYAASGLVFLGLIIGEIFLIGYIRWYFDSDKLSITMRAFIYGLFCGVISFLAYSFIKYITIYFAFDDYGYARRISLYVKEINFFPFQSGVFGISFFLLSSGFMWIFRKKIINLY